MLTGSHLLTRNAQSRIEPLFLDPQDSLVLEHCDRMIVLFRDISLRNLPVRRRQIREEIEPLLLGPGNQKVWEGMASILEKRCTFRESETISHENFRLDVFEQAAISRAKGEFDRDRILSAAAEKVGIPLAQVEEILFGDLPLEQTLCTFESIPARRLVDLYNIALVQGILLQSQSIQLEADHPTPGELRALANRMRFHRLMGRFRLSPEKRLRLIVDGPMSLFGPVHRYGFQLACFFPALLELKNFVMRAKLAWGKRKIAKTLMLRSEDGLTWPDSRPSPNNPVVDDILANFSRFFDPNWDLFPCQEAFPRGTTYWIPDLVLLRKSDGRQVYIEIPGYWKNRELESYLTKVLKKKEAPALLCLKESFQLGETQQPLDHPAIYIYRKTPLISEILTRASQLIPVNKVNE